jgi:predicted nucleic acid-binding protein
MKRYWDSSALVDALHDSRIEKLASEKDQFTRPHTLAEMFSTLTWGRLGVKYVPDDAAALIREITGSFNFVNLDASEIQAALDSARKHGVRGGNIHDWIHARAAGKAGVQVLLTDNLGDFQNLAEGFTIEAP